jgi:uncharacterized lipoprotein YajG
MLSHRGRAQRSFLIAIAVPWMVLALAGCKPRSTPPNVTPPQTTPKTAVPASTVEDKTRLR